MFPVIIALLVIFLEKWYSTHKDKGIKIQAALKLSLISLTQGQTKHGDAQKKEIIRSPHCQNILLKKARKPVVHFLRHNSRLLDLRQ